MNEETLNLPVMLPNGASRSGITPCHVSIRQTFFWNDRSSLSLAAKSPPRKLGSTPATFHSEASPSATEPEHLRPGLLGSCSASLVRLEAVSPHRHSRNCRALASSWFPSVLEAGFQDHQAAWQKADPQGGSGSDLPHGRRESNLGCASHPRRIAHAGF